MWRKFRLRAIVFFFFFFNNSRERAQRKGISGDPSESASPVKGILSEVYTVYVVLTLLHRACTLLLVARLAPFPSFHAPPITLEEK